MVNFVCGHMVILWLREPQEDGLPDLAGKKPKYQFLLALS